MEHARGGAKEEVDWECIVLRTIGGVQGTHTPPPGSTTARSAPGWGCQGDNPPIRLWQRARTHRRACHCVRPFVGHATRRNLSQGVPRDVTRCGGTGDGSED